MVIQVHSPQDLVVVVERVMEDYIRVEQWLDRMQPQIQVAVEAVHLSAEVYQQDVAAQVL